MVNILLNIEAIEFSKTIVWSSLFIMINIKKNYCCCCCSMIAMVCANDSAATIPAITLIGPTMGGRDIINLDHLDRWFWNQIYHRILIKGIENFFIFIFFLDKTYHTLTWRTRLESWVCCTNRYISSAFGLCVRLKHRCSKSSWHFWKLVLIRFVLPLVHIRLHEDDSSKFRPRK